MAYTAEVTFGKQKFLIDWDGEEVHSNSVLALELINISMEFGEVIAVEGMPSVVGRDIPKHGYAVWFLLKRIFDDVDLVEGNTPALPKPSAKDAVT